MQIIPVFVLLALCAVAHCQQDPLLGKACFFPERGSKPSEGVCKSTTGGTLACKSKSSAGGGRGSSYSSWEACCTSEFGPDAVKQGRCKSGDAAAGAAAAPAATDPMLGKACFFPTHNAEKKSVGTCGSTKLGTVDCGSKSMAGFGRGAMYASWEECCKGDFGADAIKEGRCKQA